MNDHQGVFNEWTGSGSWYEYTHIYKQVWQEYKTMILQLDIPMFIPSTGKY